jgi:hypothetical protein
MSSPYPSNSIKTFARIRKRLTVCVVHKVASHVQSALMYKSSAGNHSRVGNNEARIERTCLIVMLCSYRFVNLNLLSAYGINESQ